MFFWLVIIALVFTVAVLAISWAVWRMPHYLRVALYPVWVVAKWIGWILLGLVILALATLFTGLGINLFVGGATIVVLAMVLNRRARARRDALTELLAVCCERRVPLEPVLHAYAKESPGRYARRIERLADRLSSGEPLAKSLAGIRGLVSRQVVCAAQTGRQTGKLGPALRDAVTLQAGRGPLWNQLVGRSWLLAWPIFGLLLAVVFWRLYIFPKFVQIWDDFGQPLTWPSNWVRQVMDGPLSLLIMISLATVGTLLLFWLLFAYIGWIPIAVPLPARWLARLQTAPILRSLALFCDSGRPIHEGLQSLAENYPHWSARRQLRIAAAQVQGGADWAAALSNAGIVSAADAGVLSASSRLGNVAWALRLTAEGGERRLTYRLLALLQLVFPIAMLVIGSLVLLMVLTTFVPMARMIEVMAE